jgi:fatty-acyl-CoA synthase
MQDHPLMNSSLIEHAATYHPDTEIVSRLPEGPIRRTNWAGVREVSKQVANALTQFGIQPGDRVGTLAWNSDRHLALYYGVSGSGAVLHTVNPRLFADQITYIINHAEDQVLFFDITFARLVEQLAPQLKTVRAFIAMTDREHMPDIDVPELLCFDELIGSQSTAYTWPEFDERSASSLCYTSGTTGNPKGVLYSHRSISLHSSATLMTDANFDVHSGSSCWSWFRCSTPMPGLALYRTDGRRPVVLPGPHLDGESIYQLMRDEHVNITHGVHTVWMMLFSYLDEHPEIDPHEIDLQYACVGGAALSASMIERFERDFGAESVQGWGMTETSPLCVIGRLRTKHAELPAEEQLKLKLKQGHGIWGVDLKIVDDDGRPLPWDGKAFGEVFVRGPWIASGFKG